LAMLKYKDAVQAMQAADQMMAAAQPQPMPPTVAERAKLAAEQGIAGLAQRLAPGIQQQGGQLAAQQAQQAMQGGLPQLSAPNMARMAGGGIVAFAEGGDPKGKFTASAYVDPVKGKLLGHDDRGEPVYESDMAARNREYALMLSGVPMPPRRPVETPAQEDDDSVAARNREYALMLAGNPMPPRPPVRARASEDVPTTAPVDNNMPPALTTPPQNNNMPQPAPDAQPDINVGIAKLLADMQEQANAPIATGTANEGTNKTRGLVDALTEQRLDPNYVENTREGVETRAREAYGVPEELKALYQAQIDALNKPMFTPEEEKSRKIDALLQGLASSNLIAQGGPAAARGIAAVSDAVREDSTARAEKQFNLASSLMGLDMKASQEAFAAGLNATVQSMADQSTALSAANNQLVAEGNQEAAALIAQSQNQMAVFEAQLNDAAELRKILSDERIAGTEAESAARRDMINLQRNLYSAVEDIDATIAELSGSLASPTAAGAVVVLENQKQAILRGADAISQDFGVSVDSTSGMGSAGQFSSMSDEALLNMLGQ